MGLQHDAAILARSAAKRAVITTIETGVHAAPGAHMPSGSAVTSVRRMQACTLIAPAP